MMMMMMIAFPSVLLVTTPFAPQYLGPLNYVADLPGRRPLRSAGTNRLPVPPVGLASISI